MGNTVSNNITNVNDIVINAIVNFSMTNAKLITTSQDINVKCDESVIKTIEQQSIKCLTTINRFIKNNNLDGDNDDDNNIFLDSCNDNAFCKGNNISINNSINLKVLSTLLNNTNNNLKELITSSLQSAANYTSTIPSFANKVTSQINSLVKVITDSMTTITNKISNSQSFVQQINIENAGPTKSISQNMFRKILEKQLLSSKEYTTAATTLSNTLSSQASQIQSSGLKKMFHIIISIIISLLIIGIIAAIIKYIKKNKS